MRTSFLLSLLLLCCMSVSAADKNVKTARHAGPFSLVSPVVIDSVDASQKKYSAEKLIETPLSLSAADANSPVELSSLTLPKGTLNLLSFDVTATTYVKDAKLTVKGAKHYKLYADGKALTSSVSLQPGSHTFQVKFIADSTGIDILIPETLGEQAGRRPFTMADNLGTRVTSSSTLSPSGNWALVTYRWYDSQNKLQQETVLCGVKTGRRQIIKEYATWMPMSDKYYYVDKKDGKTRIMTTDPHTGATSVLCADVPTESFYISPTEDFLILTTKEESPKKEDGVFEIIHPDDRQPGWRTRYSLSRMDLKTGFVQPLTYTYRGVYVSDISADGQHILLSVSSDSLTQRPTTRQSFYDFDLKTMTMKQLVDKDGFINSASWAQGTDYVIFTASTEAFGGIGKRLPEGRIPNMFDHHLYVMDTRTGKVTPVTADDKTSISDAEYSPADGNVYYTAENGDSVSLYRLSLKTFRSTRLAQPLECISGMSIASKGGNIMVHGSSACVPYEVWNITQASSKPRSQKILSPNDELYAGIALGTVHPWSFNSERGDKVTGFYFLPADFDSSKKYPVIVHYYGGCSPTSRRFGNGSHYPAHYWNALGYIVFIVNPSGASGFGQEWASRHVNTMGEGPAQDIIDATRQFIKDVPQVDADKIGCVSASYGGFMTQYMLTKDNPFACGISHAGISDHTSYWGEGYWGYSYSEVSAANSYPWTRKDLFVDRSPLFNADKIKKPLLFTHGTADTNVPVGESIQMYTALRLLGTPTAFIEVEGENHGIMDPVKRTKWIDSMVAWFDRWLKGEASWWNAIYTPKKL